MPKKIIEKNNYSHAIREELKAYRQAMREEKRAFLQAMRDMRKEFGYIFPMSEVFVSVG